MAKRRKLEAPNLEELAKLEEGFAAKPPSANTGLAAPIAKVAGEAADAREAGSTEARVAQAKDSSDAEAWRKAEAEGRVVLDIPLGAIRTSYLMRDRMSITREEMDELKKSLMEHGQRLPIEVVEMEGEPGAYGLISGWRRFMAMEEINQMGLPGRDTIRAILRPPQERADAYTAMVEENEVRASLTPYERGRIAVVASDQGVFKDTDAAINDIFASASKAKRSKIRSFAMIHEELGDLLSFPEHLTERAGLRLANAVRDGYTPKLRETLETGLGTDRVLEWQLIEEVLEKAEAKMSGKPPAKIKKPSGPKSSDPMALANGITLERVVGDDFYAIKFKGKNMDTQILDDVILEIRRLLGEI